MPTTAGSWCSKAGIRAVRKPRCHRRRILARDRIRPSNRRTGATPSATVVSGAVTAFTNTTLSVTAPALTAGTYYICAYNGTAANSALASRTTTAGYTVLGSAGTLTLSATRGSSDGGTTLTATDATSAAFGPGTVLEFNNASTCPATYATPGAGVVAATTTTVTATAVTVTQPPMSVDNYTVCAYTGSTGTSAVISGSAANAYAVYGVLSLNTYNGPSAGGNSITATTSGGTFLAGTTVVFHADATVACPATYGTPVANMVATGLRVLTTNKLAFVVPAGVVTPQPAGYRACAYAGGTSGSTLISETSAATPYIVAAPATILSVSPAAGAAQGGTSITVTGTNLLGITGATVGGVPLLNVQSINGGTGFTATTPAHAAGGPFTIAVTTAGGTASKANAFTFSNGIVVSPAKAPNTKPVDVDVQGVGFGAITFSATDTNGATPNAVTGHVYLVNGRYDPSASTTPAGAFKTNDALLECTDVLVISDSELVCTLYLSGDNTQRATLFRLSNAALADASITQGTDLLTSPTDAAFTPADVGLTVSGTGIPAGTTIVSVISATQARLSSRATADVAVGALTLAPPRTTLATNTIDLTAPTTVSNAAAVFQQTDVGRRIVGPGIPAGTTITAVAVDNKSVTLSAPATVAAVANVAVRIGDPPVPNGAYTITVVSSGAVGATGPTYIQSVISSGSTFTVADY